MDYSKGVIGAREKDLEKVTEGKEVVKCGTSHIAQKFPSHFIFSGFLYCE
jgi:hypothetical protein